MYVTTQAGFVLQIDLENEIILSKWDSQENKNILGIKRLNDILFVCTQSKLYKLALPHYKVLKKKNFGDNSFHHILVKDNLIYLTSTSRNAIIIMNMKFRKIKVIKINPPIATKPVTWKKNYNHLNNIFYYKGKYYVDLNWLTTIQYSYSGVAVLDENYNELDRFTYGWESHCFCFINDKKHALCGTSNPSEAKHPKQSGLMVESEIVFDHSLKYYSKYFLKDEKNYYIFAGKTSERRNRAAQEGIIIDIDNNYNLIKIHSFPRTGGFSGATF